MTKTTLLLFPLVGMLAACGGTEETVEPEPTAGMGAKNKVPEVDITIKMLENNNKYPVTSAWKYDLNF